MLEPLYRNEPLLRPVGTKYFEKIAINLPYSWYNLVSEKLFICTGIEITIDEERAYECIIQDTGPNIKD